MFQDRAVLEEEPLVVFKIFLFYAPTVSAKKNARAKKKRTGKKNARFL
jgi:hypothetical protein